MFRSVRARQRTLLCNIIRNSKYQGMATTVRVCPSHRSVRGLVVRVDLLCGCAQGRDHGYFQITPRESSETEAAVMLLRSS